MMHNSMIPAPRLAVALMVVGLLAGGCARKITTSVQDQTFVPGPEPRAEQQAKVPEAPPAPAPAEAPPSPPPPAPVEEARVTEREMAPPAAAPPTPAEAPPAAAPPAPAAPPQPAALADVFFDFDKSLLRTEARATLEANAAALKADLAGEIVIEGHCDERGTSEYNMVLGERRARAVQRYLEDLGISASRMRIVSFGKERPFCLEHSEACWQSNRRAHFVRP